MVAFLIFAALAMLPPTLASQTSGASTQTDDPSRTAFFCALGELDANGRHTTPPRRMSFLLSGPAESVGDSAPIETYDPSGLLGGAPFTRFARGSNLDGTPSFAVTNGDTRQPSTSLLQMSPSHEPGRLDASLGISRDGRPRFFGYCLRLRSNHPVADFNAMNAAEGRSR